MEVGKKVVYLSPQWLEDVWTNIASLGIASSWLKHPGGLSNKSRSVADRA